eukprot:SM000063S20046  [mRNA]  locus=s63:544998:546946:+ [translate_table: standard]
MADQSVSCLAFCASTRVLDCFSDPLGWMDSAAEAEARGDIDGGGGGGAAPLACNLQSLDHLGEAILAAGEEAYSGKAGSKFCVALDSLSALLRLHSLADIAAFIEHLRWQRQVCSLLLLLHADLHNASITAGLEYLATATLTLSENSQIRLRQKRRTGKFREIVEAYQLSSDGGLTFSHLRDMEAPLTRLSANLSTRMQASFNLGLTEREKVDRQQVVLPYEHQGIGEELRIYDGRKGDRPRRHTAAVQAKAKDPLKVTLPGAMMGPPAPQSTLASPSADNLQPGLIHYVRDSDDEVYDSDEDPDDDLDI